MHELGVFITIFCHELRSLVPEDCILCQSKPKEFNKGLYKLVNCMHASVP